MALLWTWQVQGAALLSWDREPYSAGYILYWGQTSGSYTNAVPVNGTNAVILLSGGRYYFAVAGTNGLGTGLPSNEVSYTFTNAVRLIPTVTVTTYIEATASLTGSWTVVTNYQVQFTNETGFIRARLDVKRP